MHLTRRSAMAAGLATLAFPAAAFAADSAKRLVVIVLRGGMDGLGAVVPVGDPAYVAARGPLAMDAGDLLPLDATFRLHPRLATLHALYGAGDLLVAHAVATPYRERSHFDAQNMLETGGARPYARDSGWLNAALGALGGAAKGGRRELGLAIAAQAPLLLRGTASVATWSPSPMPDADADTLARLMDLYAARDPALAGALDSAITANAIAADAGGMTGGMRGGGRALAPLAKAAAGFLRRPDGPVAAVIEMSGWDTHANQGTAAGALANSLALLDGGVAALKADLGPVWADTVMVIATEFGRTVSPNGNRGTDHGTASALFLAGGAVAGGRVVADWPGLAPGQRHEGRDLRATTDVRAVLKGVLADHLGASGTTIFPDSTGVAAMGGLIRA
ncbi:MAG: DUF1501 domain-containing protein [Hyphomonadaceae bacterium]|nr:DUF1501 domain-containing protein [Hyphomonadaceae bacterium]